VAEGFEIWNYSAGLRGGAGLSEYGLMDEVDGVDRERGGAERGGILGF